MRIAASCFLTASASEEATSYACSGLGEVVAHENARNSRRAPAHSVRGQKNRDRCYMFKSKEQSKRVLGMIDAEGRRYTVEQEGHLNTTTHDTVLKLLERRSLRLRKRDNLEISASHNWAVDETGTIEVCRDFVIIHAVFHVEGRVELNTALSFRCDKSFRRCCRVKSYYYNCNLFLPVPYFDYLYYLVLILL